MVRNDGYAIYSWTGLTAGDEGEQLNAGHWSGMKTLQINVNTPDGETLAIQGSMDGSTWFTLHAIDMDAGEYLALGSVSASMLVSIVENPLYIRPSVSGSTPSNADFDVTIGANTRL